MNYSGAASVGTLFPSTSPLVGVELNPGPASSTHSFTGIISFNLPSILFASGIRLIFIHLGLKEMTAGSIVCRHWHESLMQLQFTSLSIEDEQCSKQISRSFTIGSSRSCFSKLLQLNLPNAHVGDRMTVEWPSSLLSFTPHSIAATAVHRLGSLIHLQCLHLHFRRQSERNIRVHASSFMEEIHNCRQLTELSVSHCSFFREDFDSMFIHHPLLSTLQLDDVCTHLGKNDSSIMKVFQHAPQLTSLTLRHLCNGILDENLLHLRHCYSLKNLTIQCPPHRLNQVRRIVSELNLESLNIYTYDKQQVVDTFRCRLQLLNQFASFNYCGQIRSSLSLESNDERPFKFLKVNQLMEADESFTLAESWHPRHLFLRDFFISPWNELAALYIKYPYATLNKGLRLEVDQKRCSIGEPLQFRIVATQLFPMGEPVTWYGGLPIQNINFSRHNLPKTHARKIPSTDYALDGLPLAGMLNRPIMISKEHLEWAAKNVKQLQPVLSNSCPFTVNEIRLWKDTPIGYMINTASNGEVNNLRVKHVSFAHRTCDIPVLYAVRDIQIDEELLCPYHQF